MDRLERGMMKKNAASLIDLRLRAMSVIDHDTSHRSGDARGGGAWYDGGIVFYPLIQGFRRLGFRCGPSSGRSAAEYAGPVGRYLAVMSRIPIAIGTMWCIDVE